VAGLVELHQQLEQPREHQEQHHQQQQPEQPAQADNKVRSSLSLHCCVYLFRIY
jgi:hypothetical protein